MTCAQGLLRLLWGGPEVGVLRDWLDESIDVSNMSQLFVFVRYVEDMSIQDEFLFYKKLRLLPKRLTSLES